MAQNKYQTLLDNSSLIHLEVVFSLLPILRMVLVRVRIFEVVAPGVILSQICFLRQRQENNTKS